MTAMSKRARRRELRRLQAFERRHAPEMEELRRLVAAYRGAAKLAENERDAVQMKLLQLLAVDRSANCVLAKPDDDGVQLVVPVRFI